jgi:hypothetical protein
MRSEMSENTSMLSNSCVPPLFTKMKADTSNENILMWMSLFLFGFVWVIPVNNTGILFQGRIKGSQHGN